MVFYISRLMRVVILKTDQTPGNIIDGTFLILVENLGGRITPAVFNIRTNFKVLLSLDPYVYW
jgi:hypothetical protein